jgi:hypothetical protein
MIVERGRDHVVFQHGDRRVTVYCELHYPGHGRPDFTLFRRSVQKWDAPNQQEVIDSSIQELIINEIVAFLVKTGATVEVEW